MRSTVLMQSEAERHEDRELPQLKQKARSCKDSTVKLRRVPQEKPKVSFTANLLRRPEIAGTDCRLKRRLCRKRIAAWKTFSFSSWRPASVRWSRASRCCCGRRWVCPDVPAGTGAFPHGELSCAARDLTRGLPRQVISFMGFRQAHRPSSSCKAVADECRDGVRPRLDCRGRPP